MIFVKAKHMKSLYRAKREIKEHGNPGLVKRL